MDKTIAQELLQYIGENLQTESKFLTPNPSVSVGVIGLLDKIAELRGISKDQNGHDFNEVLHIIELEAESKRM